jgi:predicted metal-dependent RNase
MDLQGIVAEHEKLHEELAEAIRRTGDVRAAQLELQPKIRAQIDSIIDLLGEDGAVTLIHMASEAAEVLLDGAHTPSTHNRIQVAAERIVTAVLMAAAPPPTPPSTDLGTL